VHLGVSQADVLVDDATPQYRALEWLTNNIVSTEECRLVQRYALATLLYATGEEWRLSPSSECVWSTVFFCNTDKRLTKIRLRKYLQYHRHNIDTVVFKLPLTIQC
jgi:N-glycosylase/DNA lyase